VIRHLGIDPVHFAVILVLNLEIGLLTPPIGLNLYVLSSITRTTLAETVRGVTPFILCMLVLLAIVTYVPAISMTLPELFYR
jgi:C4-dicarboxylate transporter DctM subunit